MQNFENFCSGFVSVIEEQFLSKIDNNNFRLERSVSDISTFLRDYSTELYFPANSSKVSLFLSCILINFVLPDYQYLKMDLWNIVWKRLYNPVLIYEDITQEQLVTIHYQDRDNIIASALRLQKFSRNFEIGGERISNPNCRPTGGWLGSLASISDYDLLQFCYVLLHGEQEDCIYRFLILIYMCHLQNWLFGNVLVNSNLPKKKYLFDFRKKDKSPAKLPQRKRGYTDKGTLRDQTVARPLPGPFAQEEIETQQIIKKSTVEDLRRLRQRLDDEIEISKQFIIGEKELQEFYVRRKESYNKIRETVATECRTGKSSSED